MGVVCPSRLPQAKQKLVSSGLRFPQPEQMIAEPAAAALVTAAPQRWQKAAPSATTPPHWKQVNIGIQAGRLSHVEPAREEKRKD
jgi:hypothetical protein